VEHQNQGTGKPTGAQAVQQPVQHQQQSQPQQQGQQPSQPDGEQQQPGTKQQKKQKQKQPQSQQQQGQGQGQAVQPGDVLQPGLLKVRQADGGERVYKTSEFEQITKKPLKERKKQ
jgi:hypothetical protein